MKPGKIITVAQQKGGSGKTTIAANLAIALAEAGHGVALLDTDPQGSLGRWFMTRAERMAEPGLAFSTASAWGARYSARDLTKSNDVVIIDTPPKMGIDGRPSIEVADLILVPLTPSKVDIWATEPTVDMAVNEKIPTMIVINRAPGRTKLSAAMALEADKLPCALAKTHIGQRILYAEVLGEGLAVTERQRTGPAAAEIRLLADEVVRMLNIET